MTHLHTDSLQEMHSRTYDVARGKIVAPFGFKSQSSLITESNKNIIVRKSVGLSGSSVLLKRRNANKRNDAPECEDAYLQTFRS